MWLWSTLFRPSLHEKKKDEDGIATTLIISYSGSY